MADCLISLGANVGDRHAHLHAAIGRLRDHPEIGIRGISSFHATQPIGGPAGQSGFINAAVRLETSLSPDALLDAMLEIESGLGRQRTVAWGPRPIDLDLLLYDGVEQRDARLTLPHPRMSFRRFVLEPAVEVAADMKHGPTGWTVRELLDWLDRSDDSIAVACTSLAFPRAKLVRQAAAAAGAIHVLDPIADPSLPALWLDDAAARPSAEVAGRMLLAVLESLRFRAEALANVAPPAASISGFWLDESLVVLRRLASFADAGVAAEADSAAISEWESTWRKAAAGISPKLVVLVDPPGNTSPHSGDDPSLSAEPTRSYADAIRHYALNETRRPLLHLETDDWPRLVDELTAASLAARRKRHDVASDAANLP